VAVEELDDVASGHPVLGQGFDEAGQLGDGVVPRLDPAFERPVDEGEGAGMGRFQGRLAGELSKHPAVEIDGHSLSPVRIN
jgi:hypothetical protein